MNMHECGFSVKRLQAHYQGRSYEINECEQCGLLRLFAEADRKNPRFVPMQSAEFHNIVSFMEFLIQATRIQEVQEVLAASAQ